MPKERVPTGSVARSHAVSSSDSCRAEADGLRAISLRNFYSRRIRRLLPLSAFVLVVTVLAGIAFVHALDRVKGAGGMTPDQARRAIVHGMGACHASYAITAAGRCVFGDPAGDKTIALVGDSIAQQWFPAFERVARSNHWRLLAWTKDACPFIDVLSTDRANRPYRACVAWRRNVMARLASDSEGIDLVVIGRNTYAARNVFTSSGARIARGTLSSVWARAAARTFSELRAVSDHVIVIRDTPVAPRDIPSCLSKFPNAPKNCSFPRGRSTHRDRTLIKAERAAAPDGVEVTDLTRFICPSDPCPAVTATGIIIYRDRHHMTATFSESLAPLIAEIVGRSWEPAG